MVVKIHKANPDMTSNLNYNENKVRKGEAEILWTENIGSQDPKFINEIFRARERSAIRDLSSVSFQMSINPDTTDSIQESDIPALANDLMRELGYEKQPWVLFRHHDIGRVHYHLVSIRIDEEGRKIRDYYEHKNCEKAARMLQGKYEYTYGKGDEKAQDKPIRTYFQPGVSDFKQSLIDCLEDCLKYHMTSGIQFVDILHSHGITVSEGISSDDVLLRFQGLDEDGDKCTLPLTNHELGIDVYGEMRKRVEECYSKDMQKEQKSLLAYLYKISKNTTSFEGMKAMLASGGIELVLHRDNEDNPKSITVIDHNKMHAYDMAEIGFSLSKTMLDYAINDDVSSSIGDGSYGKSGEIEHQSDSPVLALASALGGLIGSGGGGGGTKKNPKYLDDEDEKKKKRKYRR